MVLMTPDLKNLTGTLQFNTTQLSPFCFWVTSTTGNPVYAHGASSWIEHATTASIASKKPILGLHPRDETAMLVYKTIENGPTSFA